MKKYFISVALLSVGLLAGCATNNKQSNSDISSLDPSSENQSGSTTSEGGEVIPATSIQDMNILHAWNWKMTDIVGKLDMVKDAGYGAIQISPMQPKMDGTQYSDQSTSSEWWKLYQPTDLKVAESGDNFLGTKEQLTTLCSEAKKKDIKIIVDVVANHLATNTSQWKKSYPRHNYSSSINYNNRESIVKGDLGQPPLPDLDTHSSTVQTAVLEMLKSYIDCGISGFRFDAAKHIETPEENGSYKSQFWPTVLNGTTEYALSKNLGEPYYYGEILNEVGPGMNFSSYTKYMSICDNKQGTNVVQAIHNSSTNNLSSSYNTGANPDHLVLWAESHDTYANDSGYDITRSYLSSEINKAYMIQASRKDAATLYFARPSSMNATIGSISTTTGWNNKEVKAINKFHARYLNKSESVSIEDGKYFVNVRGSGAFAGAAIINVCGSNTATISVLGLPDGKYIDLISNNTFSVTNGKVIAKFTSGGCILVPKDSSEGGDTTPTVTYSSNVVLTNYNTSCYYYAWVFGGSAADKWIKLTPDHDALGFNIGNYTKYIIVENTTDTASWDNKNWQTTNIDYYGSQVIHDCNDLPHA